MIQEQEQSGSLLCGAGGPGLSLRGLFVLRKLARFLSGSTIPSLSVCGNALLPKNYMFMGESEALWGGVGATATLPMSKSSPKV